MPMCDFTIGGAMRAVIGALALVGAACAPAREPSIDPEAKSAIERSQRTSATYSDFAWNDVPDGGEIQDGWSGEFHQGDLHRVEAPHVRIVADCKKMIGTRLLVATGEKLTDPSVAKAACGIDANSEIEAAEWLGRHPTKYGMVDRIRIMDAKTVRTYEVLDNGVLVTGVYEALDGRPLVNNWSVAVLDTVPDGIFSEASLERSVVPVEYQSQPVNDVSSKATSK